MTSRIVEPLIAQIMMRNTITLTPKERMFKALLGEKTDVLPAAPCYLSLFLAEIERANYIEQYRHSMKGRLRHPVDHAQDTYFRAQALYRSYDIFKTPPDWIEVGPGASKAWAERTEIVLCEDNLCYEDKASGMCVPMHTIPLPYGDARLSESISTSMGAWDISTQPLSREGIESQIPILGTEEWLARGDFDLPRQVVSDYGNRYFISTILDTPYSESFDFLGFLGLMRAQHSQPDLFHHLLKHILMQAKEIMGAWSDTGIHGVYVQEVFTGADAISQRNYDDFVFAYNQPYFQHMRSLGLMPIHYVCGDVIPRLECMVGYDIAAVAVEESKKKFHIDIEEVVDRVAGRTTVFGNIDAIRFGIHSTPEEMTAEVRRQAGIGAHTKGFVVSTGSPFPLETAPHMIDTLVATAHSLSTSIDKTM